MSEKIRLVCEGQLNCPNPVYLTKEEVMKKNERQEKILCGVCIPLFIDYKSQMPNLKGDK